MNKPLEPGYIFDVGERVLCISNRKPCCQEKITRCNLLEVDQSYTVMRNTPAWCPKCGQANLCIQTEVTPGRWAVPQTCFKRVPPKFEVVQKTTSTPKLVDA